MTSDRIEILRAGTAHPGEAFWRQVSRNGEIVCTSHPETFSLSNARRAAKAQARKLGGCKVVDLTKAVK